MKLEPENRAKGGQTDRCLGWVAGGGDQVCREWRCGHRGPTVGGEGWESSTPPPERPSGEAGCIPLLRLL